MAELGEIGYYVNARCGVPVVVPDDDIGGTFTFLRALEDYGISRDLTQAQIGQTWLNYLIDPTLYAGQHLQARLSADDANAVPVVVCVVVQTYGAYDVLMTHRGSAASLIPGGEHVLAWRIPETDGQPIATVGVEARATSDAAGIVYLDYLGWGGAPRVTLTRPAARGTMWLRAWVDGLDQQFPHPEWPESYRLMQNRGRGLLITGAREWTDYQVATTLTPHLASAFGLAARVQGMERYYALVLHQEGNVRLVKRFEGEAVLAESSVAWELGRPYGLRLELGGDRIRAWVDDEQIFDVVDGDRPLTCGGIGLVCEEGLVATDAVTVAPV